MPAEFSVAFQTDKPLSQYAELARESEELGFDRVSVYNDLLYQPAWFPLLEMARATRRIGLGPAAVNPFLCHPLHLAAQAALLEEAAPGRTCLGIARGAWLDLLDVRPARPVEALSEAIRLIRHLLDRTSETFDGAHFRLSARERLRWELPKREVPILLGSWGPRTIKACLPWIQEVKLGGTANPSVVRRTRALLDEAGLPGKRTRLVVGCVTVAALDGRRARRLARQEVALYLPVVARLDPDLQGGGDLPARVQERLDAGDAEGAGQLIPDRLLELLTLAGTPEQLVTHSARLLEAGADRIEFGTPHGLKESEGLRLLGEEVVPALRARS